MSACGPSWRIDATVERAFVGQSQSDGGRFTPGMRCMASTLVAHEPAERGRIVVTGVVEGGFGGHDAVGIEAGRQGFKMDERTNEQARAGEQNDSECDFTGNQGLAQANRLACRCAATGHRGAEIDAAGQERRAACRRARW